MKKSILLSTLLMALGWIAKAQDATINLYRTSGIKTFKYDVANTKYVAIDMPGISVSTIEYYIKDDKIKGLQVTTAIGIFDHTGTFTLAEMKAGDNKSYLKISPTADVYIKAGDLVSISNLKGFTNLTGMGTLKAEPATEKSKILTPLP